MSAVATLAGSWLRCRSPRPTARVRMVCFPHAGGSASSYLRWTDQLPESVELYAAQYPGREDRFGEPPVDRLSDLVEPLVDALDERDPAVRLVLFGHSMGGAICSEVAAELQQRGCGPDLVIISGRQPPELHQPGDLYRSSDQELLADLRRLNPANREAFDSAELMGVLLPMIRADYQAIETYRPNPLPRLRCPLLILLGAEDPDLSVSAAELWSLHAGGGMELAVFPGDHFYLETQRAAVIARISRALTEISCTEGNSIHDIC